MINTRLLARVIGARTASRAFCAAIAVVSVAVVGPVAAQGTQGPRGTTQGPRGTWKINAATALVGLPHVAWERPLAGPRTLQVDLLVSPWRSVDHAPMQFGILVGEWRHHFREPGTGPYLGLHVGVVGFRLQKWDYRGTEFYQEGFGAVGGVTAGYEWRLASGAVLDLFFGGGTAQTKYKGYSYLTGERYDEERGWNESGEWAPYRAGVMLSLARRGP